MQPDNTASPIKRGALSPDELTQLFQHTAVDETLTTAKAAALLGVAPQTMRRWSCYGNGPIRPRSVNGRLRWAVAEIRAVLNGSTASVGSAA